MKSQSIEEQGQSIDGLIENLEDSHGSCMIKLQLSDSLEL